MIKRFIVWLKHIFTKMERELAFYPKINIEYWTTQEKLLLNIINDYRSLKGVHNLLPEQYNKDLSEYRFLKVKGNMEVSGALSHKGFEKLHSLTLSQGLMAVGENLGYGYLNYKSCFNSFVKSQSHHDIMISDKWIYCGITIERYNDRNVFIVIFTR